MENYRGNAHAEFPAGIPGQEPGYRAYIDSLDNRREKPSALILASAEQAVLRIVRSCGAVLGPVFHLADPDHTAIRAAVARLEENGPVLAVTGEGIWLTRAGAACRCPFCGVFGPDDAAGWADGACPVIAGAPAARAELLTGPVLAALHVLIDDGCEPCSEAGGGRAQGYSIDLQAAMQAGNESVKLGWICVHGRPA